MLLGFFNSPKKRAKNFCPSRLGQKLTFSSSLFGGIEETKISFRDQLTFNNIIGHLILSNFVKFTGIVGNGGGYNQQRRGSGTLD